MGTEQVLYPIDCKSLPLPLLSTNMIFYIIISVVRKYSEIPILIMNSNFSEQWRYSLIIRSENNLFAAVMCFQYIFKKSSPCLTVIHCCYWFFFKKEVNISNKKKADLIPTMSVFLRGLSFYFQCLPIFWRFCTFLMVDLKMSSLFYLWFYINGELMIILF